MRRFALPLASWITLAVSVFAQEPRAIFDGKSLDGWDGDPRFWSVEDGALVGRSTAQNPLDRTTWILWRGGEVADFEIEFEYKLVGGNSGLQFRSRDQGDHQVAGYQADLEDGPNWTGCVYEQEGRGVMARRGEVLRYDADGSRTVLELVDGAKLLDHVRVHDWNTYRIVARGTTIALAINGVPMTTLTDLDASKAAKRGLLAFQLHQGAPMEIRLRNVRLRNLGAKMAKLDGVEPGTPRWIWSNPDALGQAAEGESARFRGTLALARPPKSARLVAAADNACVVTVNGTEALENDDWGTPRYVDVAHLLREGDNVLGLDAENDGGPAGVMLSLDLEFDDGATQRFVTNANWSTGERADGWNTAGFDASGWRPASELAPLGGGPWGSHEAKPYDAARATPAEELTLPAGYRAELLYTVPRRKQGSWVAMCFDDRGRILASDQYGPLYRVTLANGAVTHVEELPLALGSAQGLCYAFGALYVVVSEQDGEAKPGLWRAKAIDGERFAAPELLAGFDGSGEHGPHAVVADPNGKRLWVVGGNHTKLPDVVRSRVPRAWGEDRLLPQHADPNGHAVGITAPGGWICSLDPDGADWELFACGFRNQYDIAFNDEREMFTFDSDMEWDIGLPWYRPTMIQHVVSGGDYGWRTGSWRWPPYYPDCLPGVVDVGIASPTGVCADRGGRFAPELATECGGVILAADWAYGTIYSVSLRPNGASYSATFEPFIKGKPLALTDLEFGPDGSLYFLVGGRRTQSALYRVTRTATSVAKARTAAANERAASRFYWSQFHTSELSPKLVEQAVADLDQPDRFVRYSARAALEQTDLSLWLPRALSERRPQATIELLVALAHRGRADLGTRALAKWESLEVENFATERLLDALRALQLVCIRLGAPDEATTRRLSRRLLKLYPHASEDVDRELLDLLVYLGEARAIDPALARVEAASRQEDRIAGLWSLRNLKNGWTLEQRARFFAALNELTTKTSGGNSYAKYLENLRADAIDTLAEAERAALGPRVDPPVPEAAAAVAARPFVKAWKLDELVRRAPSSHAGRDFDRGAETFRAAQCVQCHRFDGAGGGSGPDLTGLGSRFGDADIAEAIVEPSRTISDLYRDFEVVTHDDELFLGRLEDLPDGRVRVWLADGKPPVTLAASEIAERRPSALSRMPSALLDTFGDDEVLDLLAYLRSGGKSDDPAFARKP
ncbi:MAG: DUF1080 domain-containing protein [Planctomycetes bacterium]|nr:DUF1080 domain-containing protein [Planctomycetota bacterium]